MNREQKSVTIENVAVVFRQSPHVFLTDFRGLSANRSTELRQKIRKAGGSYRVVKNRLARRAATGTAAERIASHMTGPRGVACHATDPVALAKVLTDFAKDNPQLQLVAGVVDDRQVVGPEGIKTLASLPGLPELRAKMLGVLQAPAVQLLRLLATPASQVVRALDARREQLDGQDV